ncbi:Uncharacterised protein [Klebsiella oxytoca]|nr:Uncharacterised protein [Klebsiella oxytoca]
MSQVVAVVAFDNDVGTYNVAALFCGVEIVVNMNRWLIQTFAVKLIVLTDNCRLAPLDSPGLLRNVHQSHVADVETDSPFARHQISQLLSRVKGHANPGNIHYSASGAYRVTDCDFSQVVVIGENLHCELRFTPEIDRRFRANLLKFSL